MISWRDARRQKNWLSAVAIGGLFFGFIAKTAYEAVTGSAFFVDQHSAGFELLVWDHIVAGVVGAILALDVRRGMIRFESNCNGFVSRTLAKPGTPKFKVN